TGRESQSSAGDQMAHHRQGRRGERRSARRFRAATAAGHPRRRRKSGEALDRCAQGVARVPLLTATLSAGRPHPRRPCSPERAFRAHRGSFASAARPTMLRSALLNVMIKAARKASRTLKRDFGEIEHLQTSLKGPANFVTAADRRAEEILRDE